MSKLSTLKSSVSSSINENWYEKEKLTLLVLGLSNLYEPNAQNNDGDNLLTIFLNSGNKEKRLDNPDLTLIGILLDKNFGLQIDKVQTCHWDDIINYLIRKDKINSLPEYVSDKSDVFYLKISTKYTKKLMDYFYNESSLMYESEEQSEILSQIFTKKVLFKNEKDLINYLNEIEDVLTKLFVNKNLTESHLNILEDPNFINKFKKFINKNKEAINEEIAFDMYMGGRKKNGLELNANEYLKTLKIKIFSEILQNDLEYKQGSNLKRKKI
jgi:viroplasmin and RNaseH domain-containing protein